MKKARFFAHAVMAVWGAYAVPVYAAPADDSGLFVKPYLGLDYQYAYINYRNVPGSTTNLSSVLSDSLHGLDVHAGVRVHKYLGFEGGYTWTPETKKSNILGLGINSKVSLRGYTFDVMGYLPVSQSGRVELVGTAGVSYFTGHSYVTSGGSSHNTETNGRVGGGVQYWLTEKVNARALLRYQGADFHGAANNAILAGVGLNYQF